jgi:two-component system response regulator NreC
MTPKICIHIADDHSVVVEGLKAVIKRTAPDITVTGQAASGREALALARRSPADVYVYDISMPPPNGLDAMAELLGTCPGAKVIILSMHDDRATVEKALRAGARGYLVKESAAEEITGALRSVFGGVRYLSPSIEHLLSAARPRRGDGTELTRKEKEVVRLIAVGLGNKEIAAELGLSPQTVHVHRRNISAKLDIHKQTDLVRYAIREGLAKP